MRHLCPVGPAALFPSVPPTRVDDGYPRIRLSGAALGKASSGVDVGVAEREVSFEDQYPGGSTTFSKGASVDLHLSAVLGSAASGHQLMGPFK
jgi:hypothetical protein